MEPFLGEIKIVSFVNAPRGWAQCNGQFLPINQNQALFSILGTTYGGNGQTTFALPDFRGRIPMHVGAGFTLGQQGGEYAHTVTASEMPAHTHVVMGSSSTATAFDPSDGVWGVNPNGLRMYAAPDAQHPAGAMHPTGVTNTGGSQAHENTPPYLVLNFIIALQGIFPSRN
jgi:microcystin-dependent protein